jgi:hypothetical protein
MAHLSIPKIIGPLLGAKCFARALASPIFDDGKAIAFGSQSREAKVKAAWKNLGYKHGPLDDAIVFETGEFEYARFYLWVPRVFLTKIQAIVIASSDSHDDLFDQHILNEADIAPPRAFPQSWTDMSGPWQREIALLTEMEGSEKGYVGIFMEIKGSQGADRVQIGLSPTSREVRSATTLRPFYVAAIEVLRKVEMDRFDYDVKEAQKKQGVLEKALGLDSADNALLMPGQKYQVKITYDAERQRRRNGQPTDQKTILGKQQSFWFTTDSSPPVRLDPWVLVTLPGEGEKHFFSSEEIKIVFATNNLGLMYDSYGKKLQARLRPSSFRQVLSSPTTPHPFPIDKSTLKEVKAAVLSPWEKTVQNLVRGSCVPIEGNRIRHSMVTIPIPLDLDTDYVLDIEMLDKSLPDGTPGDRVWRRSFSTGSFNSLDDFALSFQLVRVNHRGVHPDDEGKLQSMGTRYAARLPEGSEFDDELTKAGIDLQPSPKSPNVIVFWDPAVPDPQPATLLVDSSEPMWRDRLIPTEVTDSGSTSTKRYELQPFTWLKLAEQTGDDTIVDHIIPAPGGRRALVTLKPNSRGKRLKLALQRIANPEPYLDGSGATDQFATIIDLQLTAAPWEEAT